MLTWDGDQDAVLGVSWEVRVQATGTIVARGSTQDVATGSMTISQGIVASTAYEARAILVAERAVAWTAWIAATSPATLLLPADLSVSSFQAAGLAVFGGALQSTNFVAGSLGWQISNVGNAEFNTLVVRRQQLAAGSTAAGNGAYTASDIFTDTGGSTPTELTVQTLVLTTTGGKVLVNADMSVVGSQGCVVSL